MTTGQKLEICNPHHGVGVASVAVPNQLAKQGTGGLEGKEEGSVALRQAGLDAWAKSTDGTSETSEDTGLKEASQ